MLFSDFPFLYSLAAALATWRISSVIHTEGAGRPLRKLLGVAETVDDPALWSYPDNAIGELISCIWCISVWAGSVVLIALIFFPVLLVPLALSATAILIESFVNWINSNE